MNRDKHKVTVEIYGETYNLKGDLESEKIVKLAEIIDRRMRKIAQSNSRLTPAKVAVLAALHVADEYVKLEEDYRQVMKLLKEGK